MAMHQLTKLLVKTNQYILIFSSYLLLWKHLFPQPVTCAVNLPNFRSGSTYISSSGQLRFVNNRNRQVNYHLYPSAVDQATSMSQPRPNDMADDDEDLWSNDADQPQVPVDTARSNVRRPHAESINPSTGQTRQESDALEAFAAFEASLLEGPSDPSRPIVPASSHIISVPGMTSKQERANRRKEDKIMDTLATILSEVRGNAATLGVMRVQQDNIARRVAKLENMLPMISGASQPSGALQTTGTGYLGSVLR